MPDDMYQRVVVVKTDEVKTIGYLFLRTETHVVLINNFAPEHINLGSIEGISTQWIEPEVSMFVIPTCEVSEIVAFHAD